LSVIETSRKKIKQQTFARVHFAADLRLAGVDELKDDSTSLEYDSSGNCNDVDPFFKKEYLKIQKCYSWIPCVGVFHFFAIDEFLNTKHVGGCFCHKNIEEDFYDLIKYFLSRGFST
jgi:hypothetical protein